MITSWVGGNPFTTFHSGTTGDVVGYRVTMINSMDAVGLGVYSGGDGSLIADHMVGIWRDLDGSLVASTTVLAGTALDAAEFGYAGIAPVTLNAGESYSIGAMYEATALGDNYISGATSLVTSPDITFLGALRPTLVSMGFVRPTEFTAGSLGRFGPNVQMRPVPEPATFVVIGLGIAALALRRKR
jgi:hypothetical protein